MKQPSDFGNIESRREEKHHMKKWWKRINIFLFFTISWSILIFGFLSDKVQQKGAEINYLDFLVLDHTHLGDLSINAYRYYFVGGIILIYVFALFGAKGKLEYEEEMTYKFDKKKPGLIFLAKYKFVLLFDKVIYFIMLPFSYGTLGVDSDSEYLKKKFFMRYGWLSHLERTFFKQTSRLIDGYARTKSLSDFENFALLFTKEKSIEKAMASPEYRTTVGLFKKPETLEDIFLISEGYMKNDAQKYDKFLDKKEFYKILKKDFNNNLNDFRVYDGRDKVYFSFELVKVLIDVEARRFSGFMEKYATTSTGLEFTRAYKPFYEMLKKDKNTLSMIRQIHCPTPLKENEEVSEKELIKRVKFIFEIYFRFCATFYIINQYINLPAGTVVVRMDDYTLRMIIETYDNENIISIEKRKNDGSTNSFRGDGLTNMFLLSWNYYNYSVENAFKDKVYNIFNLRDEEVEERGSKDIMTLTGDITIAAKTPIGDNVFEGDEEKLTTAKKFIMS